VSGRYWKKPSRKEVADLLDEFHAAGWRILDPPKYYTVRCPCGGHQRQVHLTPSTSKYCKNVLKWLHRQPCYRTKEE